MPSRRACVVLRFYEEVDVLGELLARWIARRRVIRIEGLMLELLAPQTARSPR